MTGILAVAVAVVMIALVLLALHLLDQRSELRRQVRSLETRRAMWERRARERGFGAQNPNWYPPPLEELEDLIQEHPVLVHEDENGKYVDMGEVQRSLLPQPDSTDTIL